MTVLKDRRWLVLALLFTTITVFGQKNKNLVYVDKQGVMRYTQGGGEASFFGINYTTPFAHAYRAHKALGADLEQAIRNDVYHFARLGFQAFRVHVWDTEISDTAGNLLENEHLRLFDFLLAELKKRNIRTIITPIAFWGNGYPERDEPTPGFSRYFGRGKLTTNDTAIRAQENFLKQFFKHVNPYTKLTYEQDRDIIAVEINNEPSHSNPKSGVTDYINRLAKAIRGTGWTKPVFYNIAQGPYFSDAVAAAQIDGVSFQWYPSGLVGNQTLDGNTLMHVDRYHIPFRDTVPTFRNKALMVYEFDAADITGSYMYPFMAKAFRGAGFQWATQFAYDPLAMAHVNTEYQTHYLNLAYTPSKAISMMIAAEVFSRVPRMKSYGVYPADSSFDVFTVSYARQLSEMNSGDKFYYSNNTGTAPADINRLQHIAGVGSSSLVACSGSGAYFLDKLADGVWRLEVMPDAIPVRDPFERASPSKTVTAIEWNLLRLQIRLPDLGDGFTAKGLNTGNNESVKADNSTLLVKPGTWLLQAPGRQLPETITKAFGTLGLNEYVAPAASEQGMVLRHQPLHSVTAGQSFTISAITGGLDTGRASIQLNRGGGGFGRMIPMTKNGHTYEAVIPADQVSEGIFQYRIILQKGEEYSAWPGGFTGHPFAWDNYNNEYYSTYITRKGASIDLFNPSVHRRVNVAPNFRRGFQPSYVAGNNTGELWYQLSINNPAAGEVMALQHYAGAQLRGREADFPLLDQVVVRVRSTQGEALLRVALVTSDGSAFSAPVNAGAEWKEWVLPLSSFQKDSAVLLPRPYPGFQPLFFTSSSNSGLKLEDVEQLQLRTVPSADAGSGNNTSIQVAWVRLTSSKP